MGQSKIILLVWVIVLELVGIGAIIGGIRFEIKHKAPKGFIAITIGSLLIAIGSGLIPKILSLFK